MERQLVTKPGTLEANVNDYSSSSFSHKPRFPIRGLLHSEKNLNNHQSILRPPKLQAKLAVSQPGDSYEQEADRVAEQVMRLPDPVLQRKCAKCNKDKKKILQFKESSGQMPVNQGQDVPSVVYKVISSLGQPLDPTIRAFMEPRFGHDFSRVRIHTGAQASESARSMNALAYTVGRDVVFGEGQYAPEKVVGRQLLAHELTHTIQQLQGRNVAAQAYSPLQVSDQSNRHELEAEMQAEHATKEQKISRIPVQSQLGVAGLQRQADIRQIPPGLSCILTTGRGHLKGINLHFSVSSSTITSDHRARIATFVSAWVATGSRNDINVDGYASVDGPQSLNWQVSCDRAESIEAELIRQGVPTSKILTSAHGETTEFSPSSLEANRLVILSTISVPSPVIPPVRPPLPHRVLPTGPFLDLQIACVTDAGGCSDPSRIPGFDTNCRATTNYAGPPLVEKDLVCSIPGMGIALSLNRAYPNWLNILPNCPCTKSQIISAPNFSPDMNPFLSLYHPGADTSFRSDTVASVPGTQHRQQCCYTRYGMLITQGGGAGTPDVWGDLSKHQRIDVQPFNEFNKDYRIYNRFWIPNQGSGCVTSNPCINRCEQIFEECIYNGKRGEKCAAELSACKAFCR